MEPEPVGPLGIKPDLRDQFYLVGYSGNFSVKWYKTNGIFFWYFHGNLRIIDTILFF